MRYVLIAAAVLALAGCDLFTGEEEEYTPTVERDASDRVAQGVCDLLTAGYGEKGHLVAFDLPALKDQAAKAEGFVDWQDFQIRLHKTNPDLEIEYSRRFTEHLEGLGAPDAGEGGG